MAPMNVGLTTGDVDGFDDDLSGWKVVVQSFYLIIGTVKGGAKVEEEQIG